MFLIPNIFWTGNLCITKATIYQNFILIHQFILEEGVNIIFYIEYIYSLVIIVPFLLFKALIAFSGFVIITFFPLFSKKLIAAWIFGPIEPGGKWPCSCNAFILSNEIVFSGICFLVP